MICGVNSFFLRTSGNRVAAAPRWSAQDKRTAAQLGVCHDAGQRTFEFTNITDHVLGDELNDFVVHVQNCRAARGFSGSRSAFRYPGGWMSAIKPHSNRERRRSSRLEISLGGRSELMMICLLALCSVLKVLKNSSWTDCFFAMN